MNKQNYPDCGYFTGDYNVVEPCNICHYCQIEHERMLEQVDLVEFHKEQLDRLKANKEYL